MERRSGVLRFQIPAVACAVRRLPHCACYAWRLCLLPYPRKRQSPQHECGLLLLVLSDSERARCGHYRSAPEAIAEGGKSGSGWRGVARMRCTRGPISPAWRSGRRRWATSCTAKASAPCCSCLPGRSSTRGTGRRRFRARQSGDGAVAYSTTNNQTPVCVTAQALLALQRTPLPLLGATRAQEPQIQDQEAGRGN